MKNIKKINNKGINNDYEFCYSLINNKPRIARLIADLLRIGVIDRDTERELRRPGLTEKQKFKYIEQSIASKGHELDKFRDTVDTTLYSLRAIINRTYELRGMLEDIQVIKSIFKKASIVLSDPVVIRKQEKLGNSNFSFFVHSGETKYFVRYHDPLGFRYFQRHIPQKTTYYSVACAQIFGELLGKEAVVGIIYPNFETARKNSFSPEEANPIDKIASSVLIQKDLSDNYVELVHHQDINLDITAAVKIYAKVLAKYHGKSFGIVRHFNEHLTNDIRIMQLLNNVGNEIRFSSSNCYGTWLQNHNWVTRMYHSLDNSYHKDNLIYSDVKKILFERGIHMQDRFAKTCKSSIKRFKENGSIGHLDFKLNNLFVNKNTLSEIKIYDFDYITFLDPSYEAGHSLYSVLKHAIVEENVSDINILLKLVECFCDEYDRTLNSCLENGNFAGERLADNDSFHRDYLFFAGFTLLSVLATEYDKYNLTSEQIYGIKQICVYLLGN
ncbi:MAG: hypothetical protein HZA47_12275 [Planctomycetes bacterium]|uniref:hypothetical protein n=1 Tax=Candidatus Wunengus sp. YC65 TaxID=3367701 RepID=UPI001D3694E8|nr:hypothetical protein [Planctomycetota bacterium]